MKGEKRRKSNNYNLYFFIMSDLVVVVAVEKPTESIQLFPFMNKLTFQRFL